MEVGDFLKNIMEESLLFKTTRNLYNSYCNSQTQRVIKAIATIYSNSSTCRLLQNYLVRSSSLRYSLTYRVFSNVYKHLDTMWDVLYRRTYRDIKSSRVWSIIKWSVNQPGILTSLSIFILFFTCGYSIASILFGFFSNFRAVAAVAGFIISGLLLIGTSRWKACLNNSLFRNIFTYIFD